MKSSGCEDQGFRCGFEGKCSGSKVQGLEFRVEGIGLLG